MACTSIHRKPLAWASYGLDIVCFTNTEQLYQQLSLYNYFIKPSNIKYIIYISSKPSLYLPCEDWGAVPILAGGREEFSCRLGLEIAMEEKGFIKLPCQFCLKMNLLQSTVEWMMAQRTLDATRNVFRNDNSAPGAAMIRQTLTG
jgi:hypothetical protein